jgi:sigma54-dependent transcription regulator
VGLDFVSVKDQHGAALYILHHPNVTESRRFERLKTDIVQARPNAQVELFDVSRPDGERIRDFYDIMPESLPSAFIIADDDTLLHHWQGSHIPGADTICHYLSQTNG